MEEVPLEVVVPVRLSLLRVELADELREVVVPVLLEVHVAQEETKSGFSVEEIADLAPLIELNHASPLLKEYPGLNNRLSLSVMQSDRDKGDKSKVPEAIAGADG